MLEDTVKNDNLKNAFNSYNSENDPNGGIGIALANAAYKTCGNNHKNISNWVKGKKEIPQDSELEKYVAFYKATDKSHVAPYNVYTDSLVKAKIIRETIGYTKLRTGKRVSTPIEKCIPERIGEVFKRCYQKSLEIQSKYPELFR